MNLMGRDYDDAVIQRLSNAIREHEVQLGLVLRPPPEALQRLAGAVTAEGVHRRLGDNDASPTPCGLRFVKVPVVVLVPDERSLNPDPSLGASTSAHFRPSASPGRSPVTSRSSQSASHRSPRISSMNAAASPGLRARISFRTIFGSSTTGPPGCPGAFSGADGQKVEVVIGANSVFMIPDPQGDAGYRSHDGAALGTTKQALDDFKSDMGTLGVAMLAPQKRVAETVEAKRIDKATTDSALSATARGLQDGTERALGFHANYMQLPAGGSIAINRDYEGLLMDAPVMTAYATLRGVGFPARIILQALRDGGRINEDEDLDALELEMEANRLAEEESERIEREERLRQMEEDG